jgi:hypothetical protein
VESENDNKIYCIKDSNVELSATFNAAPEDLARISIEWWVIFHYNLSSEFSLSFLQKSGKSWKFEIFKREKMHRNLSKRTSKKPLENEDQSQFSSEFRKSHENSSRFSNKKKNHENIKKTERK